MKTNKIVEEVLDDYASRREARKSLEMQWQLNINFMMGNQYSFIAPNGGIKEDEKQYELDVEMPGFKKEEINIDLNDGYLTINAKREDKHEENNEHGKKFVRRERSYFASRSYYVGDKIKENDIKAKYENGVLSLIVPKEEPKKLPEHKIHID